MCVLDPDPGELLWTDHLEFTVAQLLELGFEQGQFDYCLSCGRLQVDCDRERVGFEAT